MGADRSGQILGVAIAFLITTTVSTALRVYTRIRILGNQVGRDDWAMVATFILFLIYLICQFSGIHYGNGKKRELLKDEDAQVALMYWFFCEIFYTLTTCVLKLSIGLFLLRIAVVREHIWIIRLVMFFNVIFAVPYCLLCLFQCQPVSFWWDLTPGSTGKCVNSGIIVIMTYIVSALNSVADWAFGVLPIFMVKDLQMRRQTKVLVASVLGFAALGCTATLIRTPFIHYLAPYKGEFLWRTTDVAIWTTVEIGVGSTAANIATLRPLLQRIRRTLNNGVSTSENSRPLPSFAYVRSKHTTRPSGANEMDTLVTLTELRAGGNEAKTQVTISGGAESEKTLTQAPSSQEGSFELDVPARGWKSGIVQSVEIRTESEGRDRDVSDEGHKAITPYERL